MRIHFYGHREVRLIDMKFVITKPEGEILVIDVDVNFSYDFEDFSFKLGDIVTDLNIGESICILRKE